MSKEENLIIAKIPPGYTYDPLIKFSYLKRYNELNHGNIEIVAKQLKSDGFNAVLEKPFWPFKSNSEFPENKFCFMYDDLDKGVQINPDYIKNQIKIAEIYNSFGITYIFCLFDFEGTKYPYCKWNPWGLFGTDKLFLSDAPECRMIRRQYIAKMKAAFDHPEIFAKVCLFYDDCIDINTTKELGILWEEFFD